MKLHQAASFSRALMRIPKAQAVFWPGCALMGLDKEILQKTLHVLRREEPGIKAACGCCAQPTKYLEPEQYEHRVHRLLTQLHDNGVLRIYTACPNCTVMLRQIAPQQIIPIWDVLSARLQPKDIVSSGGIYALHDPCPMRKEHVQHDAIRKLLTLAGAHVVEFANCRERTRCCGNVHMLHTIDPKKSEMIRKARVAEIPAGVPVSSYCEGCLGAFRSEHVSTAHVLELLFGKSRSRGWLNRIRYTLSANRDTPLEPRT